MTLQQKYKWDRVRKLKYLLHTVICRSAVSSKQCYVAPIDALLDNKETHLTTLMLELWFTSKFLTSVEHISEIS